MANITTVARPYAKAILALAKAANSYAVWTNMLQTLALIIQDPMGNKVISNLAIAPMDKAAFIIAVAKDVLNEQSENLIKLLATRKRLLILPELYSLYEEMRKAAEDLVYINLELAQDVDAAELNELQTIIKNNFAGKVILSEQVNPQLISGGVAQIGNRVVDASIMGRLHAMRNSLRK